MALLDYLMGSGYPKAKQPVIPKKPKFKILGVSDIQTTDRGDTMPESGLKFKGSKIQSAFDKVDPKLQSATLDMPFDATMTSAHRGHGTNVSVGGAPKSKHMTGKALDFSVKGKSQDEVNQILDYYNKQGYNASVHMKGTAPHIHVQEGGKGQPYKPGVPGTGGAMVAKPKMPTNILTDAPSTQAADSSTGGLEKIMEMMGYGKPSKLQNVLSKIGQGLMGVAGATETMFGDPAYGQMYAKQGEAMRAPQKERQSMLAKILLGQMKPEAKTGSMRNYEYYANQQRSQGLEPMPFEQFIMLSKGDQPNPQLEKLTNIMIGDLMKEYGG